MINKNKLLKNPLQNFLFMYLVHRNDYPSRIAQKFEVASKEGKWDTDEWGCGGARIISNVTSALIDMEKSGVLISNLIQDRKEQLPGRPKNNQENISHSIKKYYTINQELFTKDIREEIKDESIKYLNTSLSLLKSCSSSPSKVIADLNKYKKSDDEFGFQYLIDCFKKIRGYCEETHRVQDLDKILETQDVRVDLSSIFSIVVPLNMNQKDTREFISKNYDLLLESFRTEQRECAIEDMMDQVELTKRMFIREKLTGVSFENDYAESNTFQIAYSPQIELENISKSCEELSIKSEEILYILSNTIDLLEEFYAICLPDKPFHEIRVIGIPNDTRYFSIPISPKK
jgi:hypothetical protein